MIRIAAMGGSSSTATKMPKASADAHGWSR